MRFNLRIIIGLLGLLLCLNGIAMLLCIPFSIYYREDTSPVLISALITFIVGFPLWFFNRDYTAQDFKKRDGYIIVTLGWLIMSFSGSLPYTISGAIPFYTDAFFETISGYTTTGSSILNDIESLPKGILFWRSLTQWIGGMGIIVLAIAILPFLGIGGMQLFMAESPGVKPDKVKPRIKETAKRLWFIYLGLTITEMILLQIGGMSFYDAINHSLTTMATGGFSTKQASIGFYQSPFIHYVIIIFMFLAGTNFTLTYFFFKGKFNKAGNNEEYRMYWLVVIIFTLITVTGLLITSDKTGELAFRDSLFQVISIITTTGYATADYTTWAPFLTLLIFSMMFIGASAGSTAGGVKITRHIILFKNSFLEMNRLLHPAAVIPVRLNKKAVPREITYNVLAFIMIYFLSFGTGCIIMTLLGVDMMTALGSVATTLGNIGPGIASVGPSYTFAHIPDAGKWFLSFLMLVGRLELFTVLILFSAYFWRKQ